MFGKRADGTRVRDVSVTRRFMPYLSPRRNSSLVYYTTEIEVDAALAFLEELNRERGTTLVIVTHDTEIAKRAQRIVRLDAGRVVS